MLSSYKEKDIPSITILNQIRSQLLWEKLIYNIVIKNISVSEKQISETFDLLVKKSGEIEYNISEIFVSSDNVEENRELTLFIQKLIVTIFCFLQINFLME